MCDPSVVSEVSVWSGMRFARWAGVVSTMLVLALAFYVLGGIQAELSWSKISATIHTVPSQKIWLCGALTGVSFIALGSYDILAVRSPGAVRISMGRAWSAGAIATAISNTLGFYALTATAVRYRMFVRSGLTGSQVAGVTALSSTALAIGFASVLAAAMMASPSSGGWQRAAGLALCLVMFAVIRLLGYGRQASIWGYRVTLPSARVALAQMGLGAVEMTAAIGALYVLIPDAVAVSFPTFCALYIGAVLLGIVSHAPGGLGVFEAAMLAELPAQGRAGLLAALLLYRLIYNFCPFLLAVVAMASEEVVAVLNSKADRI